MSRNIGCSNNGCPPIVGSLFVTNFKLSFCPDQLQDLVDLSKAPYSEVGLLLLFLVPLPFSINFFFFLSLLLLQTLAVNLPLCSIYRVEITATNKPFFNIEVFGRNGLVLKLSGFETKSPRNQRLYAFLLKAIFPISSGQKLFAFYYRQNPGEELGARFNSPFLFLLSFSSFFQKHKNIHDLVYCSEETKPLDGWAQYDPEKEYSRLGILQADSQWRLSTLNQDYSFSPTYPRIFCTPASISDDVLQEVGKYRSKARIPVLSWIHPENKSAILRCAQPMVGLNSRCVQDEELLL